MDYHICKKKSDGKNLFFLVERITLVYTVILMPLNIADN